MPRLLSSTFIFDLLSPAHRGTPPLVVVDEHASRDVALTVISSSGRAIVILPVFGKTSKALYIDRSTRDTDRAPVADCGFATKARKMK